ncbi:MAG: DHA2 family efflux MFS transporter permease subunit [Pseudonocardiaceae bacterium]
MGTAGTVTRSSTESQQTASAGASETISTCGWALPLVVLIAGMSMSVLDISIINVAIPTIQNEFGATTSDAQWVITGYTLAEGVVVPVTAWFGDRFGLSRVYNFALLGFAAGSALCGLAWSLNSLVIFRVVQGLLGGLLPTITMTILLRIVPRERFGTALGLYGLGAVFAPAVGPALGGYLVEYVNWRLIFFINVPVGILGAIAAVLVLPRFPRRADRRFDVLGFLTVAVGLFTLLLAVSKGEDWKWSSYRILGLITVSMLSLALFVVIELEVDNPLLDLRVFRYWPFTHSLLLISVLSVAIYSVVFLVPQFLQRGQGLGALDAGLALLLPALVMGALMPIAGRIYDRLGPRWPAAVGLTIATAASYLLHTVALDTPRSEIMWVLALQYGGLGISMMPIMSAGLAVIPAAKTNSASALNNISQRVSSAFGVAVFTAILTVLQAQLLAGRSALLPATTPVPRIGPPGTPGWLSLYAVYHQTTQQVFVGAMDNLFLLVAALFALSALGALLLRSRPTPTAPPRPSPPVTEASSQAPVTVGPAKHQAAEPGPVPATTTDDAGPTRQPVLTTSNSLAGPESAQQTRDRATGERNEPTAATVQATTVQTDGDGTSTRRPATADELNAIRTRIGQLLDQVATLRQQATDLTTTQTELATHHEQVEKRLPDHQSLARSRTGGQKPKFGPRQVELARQMHDELDKNGKRRYTVQQIADAFSVTPATIYRHLRKITSKT